MDEVPTTDHNGSAPTDKKPSPSVANIDSSCAEPKVDEIKEEALETVKGEKENSTKTATNATFDAPPQTSVDESASTTENCVIVIDDDDVDMTSSGPDDKDQKGDDADTTSAGAEGGAITEQNLSCVGAAPDMSVKKTGKRLAEDVLGGASANESEVMVSKKPKIFSKSAPPSPIEQDPSPTAAAAAESASAVAATPPSSSLSMSEVPAAPPAQATTSYSKRLPLARTDVIRHLLSLRDWYGASLEPIPDKLPELPRLNSSEFAELERELQITFEDGWKEDWHSNLLLFDKEVVVNKEEIKNTPRIKELRCAFSELEEEEQCFRNICLLLFHVYHLVDTPPMAKRVLAHSFIRNSANSYEERLQNIFDAIRRVSYDPVVLHQNGWIVLKAPVPENPAGGSHLIGRKIIWDKFEAVIVAFVKDEHLGDLWKARWMEDDVTFDLEAEEVLQAIKKYQKKQAKLQAVVSSKAAAGGRSALSTGFGKNGLPGAEHGIILAMSGAQGARHGVLWPARIMHPGEAEGMGLIGRKTTKKSMVHVYFIAPYWNGNAARPKKGPASLSGCDEEFFSSGDLFSIELVDANSETMRPYPHKNTDIRLLRGSFSFFGLPNAAFPRYVDAHRLAAALKQYAANVLSKKTGGNGSGKTYSEDSHLLMRGAPSFPREVLDMSYNYILSTMPKYEGGVVKSSGDDEVESCINIQGILSTMQYPNCTMQYPNCTTISENNDGASSKENGENVTTTSNSTIAAVSDVVFSDGKEWKVEDFLGKSLSNVIPAKNEENVQINPLGQNLRLMLLDLINRISKVATLTNRTGVNKVLYQCLLYKTQGEALLLSAENIANKNLMTKDWRKTCEKIFKKIVLQFSTDAFGKGITAVLTDSNCNRHITASNSYERAVRLPAAIRGAKKAGAGQSGIPLLMFVNKDYIQLAEKVLPLCHSGPYLKRIKAKIAALPSDARGVPLTDDSDGEGGEDTMGSPGSFDAAITSVACALQGVDMILGGDCSNAFCAVRPPGHHAGRNLRAMHASSNGFCLLNAAACAALYAVSPVQDGGRGLKRVAVLDFDAHHGNGTQDILSSCHDPRFLYISLHAGGSNVNGSEETDADNFLSGHLGYGSGRVDEGIFPGRCGDTSPHAGVLNLPLGEKITSLAFGHAMTFQVNDAILKFDPDLIILSSGFDAHINDPLNLGTLTAKDFGNITLLACQIAALTCSGRVLSLLEGGYGVPCCRIPQSQNSFLPPGVGAPDSNALNKQAENSDTKEYRPLNLGTDLPNDMDDDVPQILIPRLDKCHTEGFLDCVEAHVSALHQGSKTKAS